MFRYVCTYSFLPLCAALALLVTPSVLAEQHVENALYALDCNIPLQINRNAKERKPFVDPESMRDYANAYAQKMKSIQVARQNFYDAYHNKNATSLANLFHERASFAGLLHPFWIEGQDAIQTAWSDFFNVTDVVKIVFHQPCVRFYGNPGTSVETGFLRMFMEVTESPTRKMRDNARYSITRVESDGKWQILNMQVSELSASK